MVTANGHDVAALAPPAMGSASTACVVNATFLLDGGAYAGGASWADTSGNARNATLIGAPAYSTTFGGHLTFDGAGQYASLAANPTFDLGTRDFSVVAYVRTQTYSGDGGYYRRIFSLGSDGNRAGNFQLILDTVTGGAYLWTMSGQLDRIGQRPVADGVWHGVVATRVGNVFSLYVDGVLDVTQTWSGAMSSNGTTPLIGRYTTGASGRFNGAIARLALLPWGMSAAEVSADFQAQRARFGR